MTAAGRFQARVAALGRPFWLTLAAVIALKLAFLVTYPLNVSGDGVNYASMMRSRTSNLGHAGGYPFVVGLPVALPRFVARAVTDPGGLIASFSAERRVGAEPAPPGPAPAAAPPRKNVRLAALYVSAMNHLTDTVAVAALFLLLQAVFSTGVGVLGALVYGLNPWNVQWATMPRPEPFQSQLVLVSIALAYWAWRADTFRTKRVRYAAAFAVFAFALLAKPNAVLLGSLPVAVLVLDASARRDRLRLVAWSGATAALVIAAFVVGYHRPSTGTVRLDYLSGHNLYERLRRNPTPLYDPDTGPASKKLAILSRVLPDPAACCGPTLFSHVDWVPRAERAPYRERWLPLLETSDPAVLERAWADVRDRRPTGRFGALHYYLGLSEANALLRSVFFETVRARPGAYLAGSATLFLDAFSEPPTVLVPVASGFPGADPRIAVLDRIETTAGRFGFVQVTGTAHESRMLGYPPGTTLWVPGAWAMAAWFRVTRVETWAAWLLIVAGAALAIALPMPAAHDARAARVGPVLVVAALLVFFALWALVFDVRNKDMRLVQPLLDALVAVGLAAVWRVAVRRGRPAARPAASS